MFQRPTTLYVNTEKETKKHITLSQDVEEIQSLLNAKSSNRRFSVNPSFGLIHYRFSMLRIRDQIRSAYSMVLVRVVSVLVASF